MMYEDRYMELISSKYEHLNKKLIQYTFKKGDDAFSTFFYDIGTCYELSESQNQRISLAIALLEILVTNIDVKIDMDEPMQDDHIDDIFIPMHVLLVIDDLGIDPSKIKESLIEFPRKFKRERIEKDIVALQKIRISDFMMYVDVFLSNADLGNEESNKLREILTVYGMMDLYFDDLLDYHKDIKNDSPNPFRINGSIDHHLNILNDMAKDVGLDLENEKAATLLKGEFARYLKDIENQIEILLR